MRIAITGATGLLGRNLLFEILKNNLSSLNNLEIILLGRGNDNAHLKERIANIIINDGAEYLDIHSKDINSILNKILQSISPVIFDLSKEYLGISSDDMKQLKSKPIDVLFHVAAMTDFRLGQQIENKLNLINVAGTEKVCNLILALKVKEAVYIGSAYSCGDKTGLIKPDDINLNATFRNPYEKSKLFAEVHFKDFMSENGIKHRIFRPSTICGRMIEKPFGKTNKYDVFYSWASFFLREKIRTLKTLENVYEKPINMPIRLLINPKGGLNIVPVDYGAKVIFGTYKTDDNNECYHIANSEQCSNYIYVEETMTLFNISGYELVFVEPKDKNPLEALYYRTAGKLFTPYGLSDPLNFDISNLNNFHAKLGLTCPKLNNANFKRLINYAKKDYFGLDVSKLI